MRLIHRAVLACALLAAPFAGLAGDLDKANCTYKGVPLYGKVKIVTAFPDIKVKVVAYSGFADLAVWKSFAFAERCGEWRIVDSMPDFTIELVDAFPDVTIAWVDAFPGIQ
ncbi:hypothetical protein [Achromobacter aegrifaciens]